MLTKKHSKRKHARPTAIAKRRDTATGVDRGTAGFTYKLYDGEMVAHVNGNIDVECGDWMNRISKPSRSAAPLAKRARRK